MAVQTQGRMMMKLKGGEGSTGAAARGGVQSRQLKVKCVARNRDVGARRKLEVVCGASAARKGSRGYKVLETVPQEVMAQFVQQSMGPDLVNTTYYPKGVDTAKKDKQWYIIDAEGQTLGRLAVRH